LSLAEQLLQIVRDIRAFGVYTSLKAMRRRFADDITDLSIGKFGTISIRAHDSDYTMVRQVFRDREYDAMPQSVRSHLMESYNSILAEGRKPVIVDAGANIGSASIWFACVFPKAAIVAIEPDAENAALLRRNTARFPQISCHEAAIGSEGGYVTVINTGASATVTTERAPEGCPIITVDEAVASVPDGVLLIVKVDIEGFELDLFGSNLDWIDRSHAIFIEPHDWRFSDKITSKTFQRVIGEKHFSLYISGENILYVNRDVRELF
jgi:FkbM family methyltransferase